MTGRCKGCGYWLQHEWSQGWSRGWEPWNSVGGVESDWKDWGLCDAVFDGDKSAILVIGNAKEYVATHEEHGCTMWVDKDE